MCRPVVSDMNRMFFGDKYFELDLSKWNVVVTVTNMDTTFSGATSFKQVLRRVPIQNRTFLGITRMYVSQQQTHQSTLLRIYMQIYHLSFDSV